MINEIKKDLYKSKAVAKLAFYRLGALYYNISVLGRIYQFPVYINEKSITEILVDNNFKYRLNSLKLSSDIGSTTFNAEIKGSDLIRWIIKAVESYEFVSISAPIEDNLDTDDHAKS